MESIMPVIFLVIMLTVFVVVMGYILNKSRCTLEQAARLSDCSENELRNLIKEGYLTYRRKYVIVGPRSLDASELATARANYTIVKSAEAEAEVRLRKIVEEATAELNRRANEANRVWQEQEKLRREEAEMMRRILDEFRKSLRLIPPEVTAALRILGLPQDASFDEVRQRYRLLAKRYHPDTGGDQERFIQINEAYNRVIAWIQSQG
jgi:DnaJ-domain-containing protein 1